MMTVELDQEHGPQIRVSQGKEGALFLNIFKGSMMVHSGRHHLKSRSGVVEGRRPQSLSSSGQRLYILKGECKEEACLVQVPCQSSSLRTRGCLCLVDYSAKKATFWIGREAPAHLKDVVSSEDSPLLARMPQFSKESVPEGQEPAHFKDAVGAGKRLEVSYWTGRKLILEDHQDDDSSSTVRLFRVTSVSGQLVVAEVLCPFRRADVPNLMPFSQEDLYGVEQPGKLRHLCSSGPKCHVIYPLGFVICRNKLQRNVTNIFFYLLQLFSW